jgi:hypothetical protein
MVGENDKLEEGEKFQNIIEKKLKKFRKNSSVSSASTNNDEKTPVKSSDRNTAGTAKTSPSPGIG